MHHIFNGAWIQSYPVQYPALGRSGLMLHIWGLVCFRKTYLPIGMSVDRQNLWMTMFVDDAVRRWHSGYIDRNESTPLKSLWFQASYLSNDMSSRMGHGVAEGLIEVWANPYGEFVIAVAVATRRDGTDLLPVTKHSVWYRGFWWRKVHRTLLEIK